MNTMVRSLYAERKDDRPSWRAGLGRRWNGEKLNVMVADVSGWLNLMTVMRRMAKDADQVSNENR